MTVRPPPCAWCAEPSTATVGVEPTRYSKRPGKAPAVTKRAVTAPVCDAHKLMVYREYNRKESRDRRRLLRRKAERGVYTVVNRGGIKLSERDELERLERELGE